eukprot:scaffold45127_cov58-Phaeocystis_antarctica.AAC.2
MVGYAAPYDSKAGRSTRGGSGANGKAGAGSRGRSKQHAVTHRLLLRCRGLATQVPVQGAGPRRVPVIKRRTQQQQQQQQQPGVLGVHSTDALGEVLLSLSLGPHRPALFVLAEVEQGKGKGEASEPGPL